MGRRQFPNKIKLRNITYIAEWRYGNTGVDLALRKKDLSLILELYLVDIGAEYPIRAFWNGSDFTDGWTILKAIAWQPLPEPYKGGDDRA